MARLKAIALPALLGALLAGASIPANAGIVTTLVGPVIPTGTGFYAFTYQATLTNAQLLATTAGAANNPVSFGTIYDFGPLARDPNNVVYIGTTGQFVSNFAFSYNNTNTPAIGVTPADSASLGNVRFTYSGTTTLSATAGGANIDLGTFQIYSPFADRDFNLVSDSQTYTAAGVQQGSTAVILSTNLTSVPEPATLGLLAVGLIGAGLIRRRA